jgi:ribosomal-protein-serine acetyltransferase
MTCPLGDGAELRPLEPWQAAELAAHIDQERAHLAPWIGLASLITDTGSAAAVLRDYAERQARDAGRICGIWLDGKLAGGALFRDFDAGTGTCEIGVWLAAGAQGRGLVTKAARHMIDWAFGRRGMIRVEWRTEPANARSIAAARRLGMTREGVLRQAGRVNGRQCDVEIWSVLASEWPVIRARPAADRSGRCRLG